MTSSWMLVAGFMFAAMGVFVKFGAEFFGPAELAFYRSLVTAIAAFIVLQATGGTIGTRHLGMHLVRSIVGVISLIAYFYSITQLPLATAQTLNYTSPLFLAIATTVVLRESFSRWLVFAIALGFGGMALLLQPSFEGGKEGPAMLGLFSGILSAWAYLSVRTLGRLGEPDWRVLFWFGVVSSIACAGWHVGTSSFHAVTWGNVWILAGIGICGTLAQLTMTRAYRTGNTLVVGSLSYSTILYATIFTYLIWDERLQPFEWAGMGIIVASGIIAMRVEKKG